MTTGRTGYINGYKSSDAIYEALLSAGVIASSEEETNTQDAVNLINRSHYKLMDNLMNMNLSEAPEYFRPTITCLSCKAIIDRSDFDSHECKPTAREEVKEDPNKEVREHYGKVVDQMYKDNPHMKFVEPEVPGKPGENKTSGNPGTTEEVKEPEDYLDELKDVIHRQFIPKVEDNEFGRGYSAAANDIIYAIRIIRSTIPISKKPQVEPTGDKTSPTDLKEQVIQVCEGCDQVDMVSPHRKLNGTFCYGDNVKYIPLTTYQEEKHWFETMVNERDRAEEKVEELEATNRRLRQWVMNRIKQIKETQFKTDFFDGQLAMLEIVLEALEKPKDNS